MRALLLAAGFGTRLRPLTDSVPKCLVEIAGKPLLAYWLDLLLRHASIERVIINTHYLPERVKEFIAGSRWRDRIDLFFEESLLGTGGTLLATRHHFPSGAVLVAHADNLSLFDLDTFLACHAKRPTGCVMTMMTFDTDSPSSCGIVELDGSGVVVGFHEKSANPPGRRANGAVYIIEQEVIDFAAGLGRPFVDISVDIIPHYIGHIATFHNDNYHRDIGTPESYQQAQQDMTHRAISA